MSPTTTTYVHSANWIQYITIILLLIIAFIIPAFCDTLYAMDRLGVYWAIDPITGEVQEIGEGGGLTHELVYDCINQKMYAGEGDGSGEIREVHILNGTTIGGVFNTRDYYSGDDYPGLEFVGSILYGWNNGDDYPGLRIVDPVTGNDSTIISQDVYIKSIGGLAYDIYTNTMYGITSESEPSFLVSIDLETGLPTFLQPTGIDALSSLTFGGNGVLYASTSGSYGKGDIYTIDIETGAATLFANVSSDKIGALAFVADDGLCFTLNPSRNPTQNPTRNPTPFDYSLCSLWSQYCSLQSDVDETDTETDSDSDSDYNYRSRYRSSSESTELFAVDNANEENDALTNDENSHYTITIEIPSILYILPMILIFVAVNMFGCWWLSKRK